MYWYSYWKRDLSKKSLATGVLQEIARRCNSKVKFGTVVSTIEELQFSVKVRKLVSEWVKIGRMLNNKKLRIHFITWMCFCSYLLEEMRNPARFKYELSLRTCGSGHAKSIV